MAAARAAADDSDELSETEKTTLKDSLADLTIETPRTPLATERFRNLVAKAGPLMGGIIKDIVSPLVLAEVKKKLGLDLKS